MKRAVLVLATILAAATLRAEDNLKEQVRFGIEAARQNLWNEARFRWEKVLEKDPANGAAHNNLGVACEREGKIKEALEEYRQATKALPGDTHAKSNLQRCEELLKSSGRQTQEGSK